MSLAEAPTLAMLRRARRLTPRELARQLGVAATELEAWEAGRRYPSPRQQHALCQVLQVTRPALFRALAATYDPSPALPADGSAGSTRRCGGRGRRKGDQ